MLCSDTCPLRFYPNFVTQSCLKCPYDCLTCDQNGGCTSCSDADFRILINSTKRCVPLPGYFDNSTSKSAACLSGCSQCQSLDLCLECAAGSYLFLDGLCYSQCPDRFFGSNQTQRCSRCPYDCMTCDESGDCTSCNETNDHRRLFSDTQRCLPLPGYFDNLTQVGVQCFWKCNMCLNTQVCSSCIQGYYLSLVSSCESLCQPRYKQDATTLTCSQCPYDCYNCDDNSQCTTCDSQNDHRVLNNETLRC